LSIHVDLVFEQMPASVILQLILYKTPVKTDFVILTSVIR